MHYFAIERDEKSPACGRNGARYLKSFALQACALPLCYNYCPKMILDKSNTTVGKSAGHGKNPGSLDT